MLRKCRFPVRIARNFTTTIENTFEHSPHPVQDVPVESRLLKVAIIGSPNAGKSTLINQLMDRKVCPTSSKVHTTRHKSMAVFTDHHSQIVFVDTPGLVNDKQTKKYNLAKTFMSDCQNSLSQADVIGVVHDASNIQTRERLDIKAIKLLEMNKSKSSFLIFNKVDILRSKRKLLDLTRVITENCIAGKPFSQTTRPLQVDKDNRGWPHFTEIFMVSALTGSGLNELREYLLTLAKPSKWMFPEQVWTDQNIEQLIADCVRAKLLDFLPQEIPYLLRPELEYFDINESGVVSTVVLVHCPSQRVAKLIAGNADGRLRQITESLQNDLQNTFHNYVRIRIVLKAPEK